MSTPSEQLDLTALNELLATAEPARIVAWSVAQFADRLVMSSSFGAESAVLIHLAIQHRPDIKIIFVDTGFLFPQTHQFMEQLRQRFSLNIWSYRTLHDPFAYLHQAAEDNPQYRKDVEACCAANKNEPFERAMKQLAPAAWLRGIRGGQSDTRRAARPIEWSKRYGCYAISPLLQWGSRQLYQYMKQHDLPRHPLVDQGYLSVGCNPLSCTRPVQIGEDARSGRWAGKAKTECGLHLDSLDSSGL